MYFCTYTSTRGKPVVRQYRCIFFKLNFLLYESNKISKTILILTSSPKCVCLQEVQLYSKDWQVNFHSKLGVWLIAENILSSYSHWQIQIITHQPFSYHNNYLLESISKPISAQFDVEYHSFTWN